MVLSRDILWLRSGRLNIFDCFLIAHAFQRQLRRLLDPLGIGQHGNRIPRTVFGAERAADAALDIHFNQLLKLSKGNARNNLDAIDGTENNTGLTTGTTALINDGKKIRLPLARRFAGNQRRSRPFSGCMFSHVKLLFVTVQSPSLRGAKRRSNPGSEIASLPAVARNDVNGYFYSKPGKEK